MDFYYAVVIYPSAGASVEIGAASVLETVVESLLEGLATVVVALLGRLLAVEMILATVVVGVIPVIGAWVTEDAVDAGIGETFSGVFASYLTVDVFMLTGFPDILFTV